jgi:hypothetical protein
MEKIDMNEIHTSQSNLLDTTDCLEAVGVFKGWKNFLFVITILCVLLLQVCFWLVDRRWVKPQAAGEQTASQQPAGGSQQQLSKLTEPNKPAEPNAPAIKKLAGPNTPAVAIEQLSQRTGIGAVTSGLLVGITLERLTWAIRFINALLILTATFYCLTVLFTLKVSMLGRLGGINHIARAFFLSLLALVLILPWQRVFGNVVFGAIFAPDELLEWFSAEKKDMLSNSLYYLRFSGYWLLVLLLLIFSFIRGCRWANAILRRLEVI